MDAVEVNEGLRSLGVIREAIEPSFLSWPEHAMLLNWVKETIAAHIAHGTVVNLGTEAKPIYQSVPDERLTVEQLTWRSEMEEQQRRWLFGSTPRWWSQGES